MFHYITMSLVFMLLAYAVFILFKRVIFFQRQSNDLQEREADFIYKLVSQGKLKLKNAFQVDDYTERHITDKGAFKMEEKGNELSINEVHTAILEKVKELSEEEKRQLLKYLDEEQISEKRKYGRKDFIRVIDYTVGDRYYRDFIQDISEGGLFVETSNEFSVGQEILMTFISPDYQKPFKVHGEITHAQTDGIGVKFKIKSQVQESVLKSYVNMIQSDVASK